MLHDYLAGQSLLEIARKHDVPVAEVIDVVRSPESRLVFDALREAAREQSALYLEQHRTHLLKRLVAIALHTRTLGIDVSTPSGAFVIECIRKACSELLRLADGRRLPEQSQRERRDSSSLATRPPNPLGSMLNLGADSSDIRTHDASASSCVAPTSEVSTTDDDRSRKEDSIIAAENELDSLMNLIGTIGDDQLDGSTARQLGTRMYDAMQRAGLGEMIPNCKPTAPTPREPERSARRSADSTRYRFDGDRSAFALPLAASSGDESSPSDPGTSKAGADREDCRSP